MITAIHNLVTLLLSNEMGLEEKQYEALRILCLQAGFIIDTQWINATDGMFYTKMAWKGEPLLLPATNDRPSLYHLRCIIDSEIAVQYDTDNEGQLIIFTSIKA
jgi:hypothetical protein